MSAYTAGVFNQMAEQAKEDGVSMTIVDIQKPVIGYL
jgi:anti-anti-sigma regulatory factor